MEEILSCITRCLVLLAVTPFILGVTVFGFRMLAYAMRTEIKELWEDFWEE